MAKVTEKLGTAIDIDKLGPGKHGDGHGLSLIIDSGKDGKPSSPRWSLRIYQQGRAVDLGLGRAGPGGLSAAEARAEAARLRAVKASGEHIAVRTQATPTPSDPNTVKFSTFADRFLEGKKAGFKNLKHYAQWKTTIEKLCLPLRGKSIADITVDDILTIIRPIWLKTPETANRARGRIESIFTAAEHAGLYSRKNPALRSTISHFMPSRPRVTQQHHAAMAYAQLPKFFTAISTARVQSLSNYALRFLILSAARSGEVRLARWSEIDEQARLWRIPAERMKTGQSHDVPLSNSAVRILDMVRHHRTSINSLIFPGTKKDAPLSDMSLLMVLRRMELPYTPHGFRSSFRDWAFEQKSNYPGEIAEICLAHSVGTKVELAYRRSKAIDQRRLLLEEWALFVDDPFQ